jgi:hypothetical protein
LECFDLDSDFESERKVEDEVESDERFEIVDLKVWVENEELKEKVIGIEILNRLEG